MNSVANISPSKITRRPWTTNEDDLLVEMLLREVDYGNAGKALGRTYAAVNNRAIKHGLSKTKLAHPGTDKNSKASVKKAVRPNKRTSALMLKIRNYRIVVGLFALAEAATLTMLVM